MAAMADRLQEQALVEQFRRGDDSAFDRIVERHAAEIAALANRLLAWPQDVDDVVQDVFVSAFTSLRRFRGDCRLRTWLFTITINKCRSYRHRRLARRREVTVDGQHDIPSDETAATEAIDTEGFARVRHAVQALPPKYREVVVLRYLEGLETAEICRLLRINANAVQVRLNRARKQLKDSLSGLVQEDT
ncbi:MAG: RNA polymerase sigma factor [Sedimentisphaerales bacterium]|nr:RNA polymerase sigma factor [Sedimentisphaerales bacterium]